MTLADMAVLKEAIARINMVRKNEKSSSEIRFWLRDAETMLRRAIVEGLDLRAAE